MQAATIASQVSLIIPAHKLDTTFQKCLEALTQFTVCPLECIIVLDGCTHQPSFFPKTNFPVHVLTQPKTSGPAVARNFGAKHAKGNWLLFIDSDVAAPPTLVEKIAQIIEAYPQFSAFIGSYDDQPEKQHMVSKFRNLLHHWGHQQETTFEAETFWAGCGIVRKDAFEKVKGFDTSFAKPSIEDIAFGYKLRKAGHTIGLAKNWQVKHLKYWSLRNMVETDVFARAKPWTKLLHENKSWSQTNLNVKSKEKLSAVLWTLGGISLGMSAWNVYALLGSILFWSCFLFLQRNTYYFLSKHFRFWQMPFVFGLHGIYFLSAITGYALGTLEFWLASSKNHEQ